MSAFASCTDDDATGITSSSHPALEISVTTAQVTSRDIIDGSTLPDGSQIGLSLDGSSYSNVLFTASDMGEAQKWTSEEKVRLSDVNNKLYAYYPYSETVTDITQIPVETASQTDYMYATPVTVNNSNSKATLEMQHALAVIRLNVVKGDFSSDAVLSSIRIRSTLMATSASLNAKTGAFTSIEGASTWFTESHDNVTLTKDVPVSSEFLFIPAGTNSADIDMMFTINDDDYTLQTTPTLAILSGNIYEYTVLLNDSEMTLKSVAVEPWTTQNKGSQNGVPYSIYVKAVKPDGTLIDVDDADESCIAVALLDGPEHFWIEKYEYANETWKAVYEDGSFKSSDYSTMGWCCYGIDITSIPNFEIVGGGINSVYGYPSNENWRAWANGALSDFNGENNTAELIVASVNDDKTYEYYPKVADLLNHFNKNENKENKGYIDWYLPSCGQLFLISLHYEEINIALDKIGGTPITKNCYYFSSSARQKTMVWAVVCSKKYVNYLVRHQSSGNGGGSVRFIRDINF